MERNNMSQEYLNASLSPEVRAQALLEEMSNEEKLSQLCGIFPFMEGWDDYDKIAEQTRCGIGQVSTLQMRDMATAKEACDWQRRIQTIVMQNSPHHIPAAFHMEGLCGAFVQDATSFPAGISRGAGFDPALEEKIAAIVSREEASCGITQIFGPVLDVNRDPRMGRTGESYGEDPTLAAVLGTAFTRGLQETTVEGRHPDAAAKHFLAFHNSQAGVHGTNSPTPPRLFREVYGKPFQAAIRDARLHGIMPCYDSIDGEPASISSHILNDLLRGEMGFDGVTVSDYGAVENTHTVHHLEESLEDAGYRCMKAGMDVELPNRSAYNDELLARFNSGAADVSVLDKAALRVLTAKFRMGLFEHPFALEGEEFCKYYYIPGAREISLQSARESIVLLRNDGVLPLSPKLHRIALIGPHADHANKFFGGYTHLVMAESTYSVASSIAGVDQKGTGENNGVRFVPGTKVQSDETPQIQAVLRHQKPDCRSLLEELRSRLSGVEIVYAYGYPVAGADETGYAEALDAIKGADLAILTLGGKHGTCSICTMGEGVDATSINLPACQEIFIRRAAALGVPMVGVHLDGRPISSDAADECLNAILECWSPAETGAQAITDVLTGAYNPAGRLPLTVAYNAGQVPIYYNHPYGSNWHQADSIGFPDYVDAPHTPRYYFGYGLSYTTFHYSYLQISDECTPTDGHNDVSCNPANSNSTPNVPAGSSVNISCTVENTGRMEGDEVVQLYIRDAFASVTRPVKELAGFARIHLLPGENKKVTFTIMTSQLAFLDENMRWKIEHGDIEVQIGASSEDIRLQGGFRIKGDQFIEGRDRAMSAQVEIR
jgi:beta-glucosidase